jgi:hypothetical protein
MNDRQRAFLEIAVASRHTVTIVSTKHEVGRQSLDELESALKRELDKGERILWSGKPDCWRQRLQYFPITALGMIWFAAMIIGFLLSKGHASSSDEVFLVGGVPLNYVPVTLLWGWVAFSPVWNAYVASVTIYAVTDCRIVILCRTRKPTVLSYHAADIGPLVLTERPDGSGTLVFQKLGPDGRPLRRGPTVEQLNGVSDVSQVEKLIRQTFLMSDKPVSVEPLHSKHWND